jgi:membrane-bound metal-dependent hydrolase YbcI (DUF457 family)
MMGDDHFISGGITGGIYCSMLDLPLIYTIPVVGLVMFFALVPDIDCPGSTITRDLPLIGKPISWFICRLSHAVYVMTRTPRDKNSEGTHRHLSHTVVFALIMGIGFGVPLASFVGAHWGLILGGAIALGCWTHCLGDSLTVSGCPWLWPLPIAGRTWYDIGTPRWIRFHTGSSTEKVFAFLVLYPGAALAFPGVFMAIYPLVINLYHGIMMSGHGGTVRS